MNRTLESELPKGPTVTHPGPLPTDNTGPRGDSTSPTGSSERRVGTRHLLTPVYVGEDPETGLLTNKLNLHPRVS